ncbi:MAG: type I-U CRISPR-associated protein Cas5/Cas6 [Gemmataceae bacterium]|nr:type I-U CRISPR-associated protein Cas5/Cas6 [Gemmataceae bacterium]
MGSYFCLSANFLDPAFHGRGDGGEPEWPPSPLRLYQAVLAAAAARWRGPQFAEYAAPALNWLAGLGPPVIAGPVGQAGTPFRIAVPNNDMDVSAGFWVAGREPPENKSPQKLKAMKTVRPTRVPDGAVGHYLWELPDPVPAEVRGFAETLAAAARSVVALGWGVDLVAGHGRVIDAAEADALPGERWRPTTASDTPLRVPMADTLAALADRHQKFLGRLDGGGFTPVPPLAAFRVVPYRRATDPPARPVAAFELRDLDPDRDRFRPFDTPRHAATVAGMVRHAVAELAGAMRPFGWTDEDILAVVHGHTPDGNDRIRGAVADRRLMFLPLPTLESRGGAGRHVGMIRRVLIVGPPDGRDAVVWARVLSGHILTATDGSQVAGLRRIDRTDSALRTDPNVGPYLGGKGGAAVWSTVTPVVLPGYDERDPRKAWGLLRKAFVQAGLPPELVQDPRTELDWRAVGFRAGVGHVREYRRPDPLDNPPCTTSGSGSRWRSGGRWRSGPGGTGGLAY